MWKPLKLYPYSCSSVEFLLSYNSPIGQKSSWKKHKNIYWLSYHFYLIPRCHLDLFIGAPLNGFSTGVPGFSLRGAILSGWGFCTGASRQGGLNPSGPKQIWYKAICILSRCNIHRNDTCMIVSMNFCTIFTFCTVPSWFLQGEEKKGKDKNSVVKKVKQM